MIQIDRHHPSHSGYIKLQANLQDAQKKCRTRTFDSVDQALDIINSTIDNIMHSYRVTYRALYGSELIVTICDNFANAYFKKGRPQGTQAIAQIGDKSSLWIFFDRVYINNDTPQFDWKFSDSAKTAIIKTISQY